MLATRSLILFAPPSTPTPAKQALESGTAPHFTPNSTPTRHPLLLAPESVTMPIQSLLYADADSAYYLIHHLLVHSLPTILEGSADSHCVASASREVRAEAEEAAWGEIAKAKQFGVALGRWFSVTRNDHITEQGLKDLAEAYGLGLQQDQLEVHIGHELDEHEDHAALAQQVDLGGAMIVV